MFSCRSGVIQWEEMGSQDADLAVDVGAKAVINILLKSTPEANGKIFNIHVPGWELPRVRIDMTVPSSRGEGSITWTDRAWSLGHRYAKQTPRRTVMFSPQASTNSYSSFVQGYFDSSELARPRS